MQKFIFSLLLFFCCTFFYAQNISISWEGTEILDYGFTKKTYPKFTNVGYEAEGNSIYINVKGRSEQKNVKASNFVWEKISRKELYDLNELALPQKNNYSTGFYFNKNEGAQFYNARISTFKYEKGTIYRLKSFTLGFESDKSTARTTTRAITARTTENPLKSGTFYKIKVDKSGIFKITKKFLADNGINVSNFNPKNFRIYGNGGLALPEYLEDFRYETLQENAIQVVGENDGIWNDEDYALFYAQGPNGFNVYKSESNGYSKNARTETRSEPSLNFINIYDDYAYYFINFDLGPGKRIADDDISLLTNELFSRYDDYQYINEEKTNLLRIGRTWVGDPITAAKTIKFTKRSPIRSTDVIYYGTSVVALKSQNNSLKFDINGIKNYSETIPNDDRNYVQVTTFSSSTSGLSGNEITINITPTLAANPNGTFYFDYAEVLYKEDLKFNDSQMNFRFYEIDEESGLKYGFSLENASTVEQVWEVSDITNAKRKLNKSGGNAIFSAAYMPGSGFNNEFVAFKNSAAYAPSFVGKIENQNLSGLQNIDYLIITKKEMLTEAKRLADYHQNVSGFNTEVVDVNKIYNEFSSGGKDITAIRDFVAKLKNQDGRLKYVLLLGDTSYDYKDKTQNNDNIVPSYQSEESSNFITSFVTDDYFVMTDSPSSTFIGNNLPSIPIGRLPASNLTEAKLLVDKTLAYYNALPGQSSPFGVWRMKLDFVVDDDFDGGLPFHNLMNDAIVKKIETGTELKEYNIRKLYLDAFPAEMSAGGQIFPQVNQAIANDVGNSLYMFYFGHGGINGWAQERVLTLNEILNFNNFSSVYSRFPLVSTITCEFTLWDEPMVRSAGEQFIKLKTGGAATMITSSRAIHVSYGRSFTEIFTDEIFNLENNDFHRLGDAHLAAKITKGPESNHLKVNYLGDPAMKLSRPKPLLSIDKIESPVDGQFRALDFVKITGKVLKADGSRDADTNFNGKVVVNIFDKRLKKTTLNNDKVAGLNPVMPFTEEGSAIVKSSGKVVNGIYTVEFYVPKDINYEVGAGRMLLYADNFDIKKKDNTAAYDVYYNQPYQIGGINEKGINDSEPPKVNLFMNNTNFADGGITDQNPTLLACITDNSGINSTGSGIGHDITVILDGQVIETKVLNDFFSAGEGNGCVNASLADYQKGTVAYPFRNLSPGAHQLTFKVWDINNNSTTATLNFVVKDGAEQNLTINRLLNWPNPFTDKTYIHFEHNCDDILDVNVQIYTITGKLVRTLSVPVSSDPYMQGYRTPRQAIEWDGKDDFGDAVGKGTYIYKVFVKSQNQDKCKGTATGVEKMVILR